jgi:hypothetical protein
LSFHKVVPEVLYCGSKAFETPNINNPFFMADKIVKTDAEEGAHA